MKFSGLLFFPILMVVTATACGRIGESFKLSGRIIDETREVKNFDAIDVSSGINLYISQGTSEKLMIRADERMIDQVKSRVEEGVLKIYCDRTLMRFGKIEAWVTVIELSNLKVSAGSDIKTEMPLSLEELTIEISSGSDLEMDIKTSALNLSASSGSNAKIIGKTNRFSAQASSGSDIRAGELEAETVDVRCSSGSDIHVLATTSIEVQASSGSDVTITGDPEKRKISSSGGSDVNFR